MPPPPRKPELAFMGMMEKFFENHSTCDCKECQASTKKLKQFTSKMTVKDDDKENSLPTRNHSSTCADRHYCPDHRPPPPPRKASAKDKDKDKDKSSPAVTSSSQQNRADKINRLLKADSIPTVLEVFKSTPTTADENKLATELQDATAQCKTFVESKAKVISFCHDDTVDLDAVFGLLAKFRQERSILTSAIIKSNSEREKTLQAIHEVDDLLSMLRDIAKDSNGSGEGIRHSLGNLIFKVHELAKNPSALYEELMDLREEHLDLLADHEEQTQKFMDIESCHEKLHEDKKKLQDDLAWEKREHLETRKRLSAMSGTKNEVNQAHKSLEKVHEENVDLKKEVEKLTAELAKINALKHENTQLKKKLATAEAAKQEVKAEEASLESAAASKKKKSKKTGTVNTASSEPTPSHNHGEPEKKPDQEREREAKELRALQQAKADIQSQLDTAQTKLRQLEALLKKAEVAKNKAVERQQVEQATAQNWKELSEGHMEESNRLREQLDESMTNASSLQSTVHQLEQSLAEVRDQLKGHIQKRTSSPSVQSQTSGTSRFDTENVRMLRKLRGETAQLVQDLDTARNYPGDPWNLVECTRNMVAAIDQDLENMLAAQRETESFATVSDGYLPYSRGEIGVVPPPGISRASNPTPPLSERRPRTLPSSYHRPLLPPGLADSSLSRASPNPTHLPSPIGSGRPGKSANGLTPSPTQVPAKTVNAPASSAAAASPAATASGLGNGAAGVDWSIWTKR